MLVCEERERARERVFLANVCVFPCYKIISSEKKEQYSKDKLLLLSTGVDDVIDGEQKKIHKGLSIIYKKLKIGYSFLS